MEGLMMIGSRHVLAMAVMVLFLAGGRAMAQDSLLANAGFEEGTGTVANSWTVFGKNTIRVSGDARGGIYAGRAAGENTGTDNFGGFFQNVEAKAGEQWAASVWMEHKADDPLKGACEAFAKIEFYDGNGDFLDALESADRLTSGSSVDTYLRSGIVSIAPPKTASVRIVAMFAQFDGKSAGTVYFDDAELRRIEKK
jgi:hypothetical protein